MVAVVSGSGLGLFNTSASTLGAAGVNGDPVVGRGRDRIFVNTTTGNLIVQSMDESISAYGIDPALIRTYNSQGRLDGELDENWNISAYRRVTLQGTLNANGSTVTKEFGDGSQIVYEYVGSGIYQSTDGDGAHDTLSWDSTNSIWIWTDGTTRTTERYDSSGRITEERNAAGVATTFSYTGDKLTYFGSGGWLFLNYTDDKLTSIRSHYDDETVVHYTYDDLGRLTESIIDFSARDGVVADTWTYVTTYRYYGTSNLLAETTQRGGVTSNELSSASFTYELTGGLYRVKTVTDGEGRVTTFDYTLSSNAGGTPVNAPANLGVLQTTETQVNVANFPRNNAALTNPTIGWGSAALLESASGVVIEPKVAFDSNGDGWAVWAQGSDVFARRYTKVNDTWAAPVTLDTTGNAASAPTLAVDAAGNAVVAWAQSNGSAVSAYAKRFEVATGTWTTTTLLETTNQVVPTTAYSISAAIDGTQAAVAFLQSDGTRDNLYVVRRNGSSWTTATLVESRTNVAAQPSVDIDSLGNVGVVFQQSDGTANSIYVNRYSASAGTWSGASLLESASGVVIEPKIMFDSNGNGFAIWAQGADVFARRYTRSTNTWATAVTLDSNGNTASTPTLAMDAAGNAVVAWAQSNGTAVSAYANRYNVTTGTWSGASLLETTNQVVANTAYSISASVNGTQAAVAFLQNDGTRNNLWVTRLNGASWGTATLVESRTQAAAQPSVSIDALGNTAVVLQQSDGAANSIYVNRYIGDSTPYYTVPNGATWQSVAAAIYGAGANTAAAGAQLASQMPGQVLAQGNRLAGFPATLTVTTTSTVTVPAYYALQSNEDWYDIAFNVYGTRDENAVIALIGAAGNPPLTEAAHITVPLSITYTPSLALNLNAAGLSEFEIKPATTSHALLPGTATNSATLGWSPVESFESLSAGVNHALTAVNANGDGIAVYTAGNQIYARRFSAATQSWSVAQSIGTAYSNATAPTIDIDTAGNVVVAWGENANGVFQLHANVLDVAAGTWRGDAVVATGINLYAGGITVSIKGGSAAVSYLVSNNGVNDLYVARIAGTNWLAGQLVDSAAGAARSPALVVDSSGNVTAIWEQEESGYVRTYSSRWSVATGTWSAAVLLNDPYLYYSGAPRLGIDAAGNVLASFFESSQLVVRRFDLATGTWQTKQVLTGSALSSIDRYDFEVTASGDAMVAWVEAGIETNTMLAARYSATEGQWYPADIVARGLNQPSQYIYYVDIQLTSDRALLSWVDLSTGVQAGNFAKYENGVWGAVQTMAPGPFSVSLDEAGNIERIAMSQEGGVWQATRSRFSTPYLTIPVGASWQALANTLYGVDSVAAGNSLRDVLGNPPLTAGIRLVDLPTTLVVKRTVAALVEPYYIVQAGDTWESIALALYGETSAAITAALRRATVSPDLIVGTHITMPSTLYYGRDTIYLQTDVTNSLGETRTYVSDEQGRLTRTILPAVNGVRVETVFAYDTAGNVISATQDPNGLNRVTVFGYDTAGNLKSSRDTLGNTVTRDYDTANQLIAETRYTGTDPDGAGAGMPAGAMTAHFLYDSVQNLRYEITAEGRVIEHFYDAGGHRITTRVYTDATYETGPYTEGALSAWTGLRDKTRIELTQYQYDFRGELGRVIRFAGVDQFGNGLAEGRSETNFENASRHFVRQSFGPLGSAYLNGTAADTFTYIDFLGKLNVTSKRVEAGGYGFISISQSFDDIENTIRMFQQDVGLYGLPNHKSISYLNRAGQVTTLREMISTLNYEPVYATTTYLYDAGGNLRMTTDPTGARQYLVYDAVGRKVGAIDAVGRLQQFIYNGAGELIKTVSYSSLLSTATLASLLDAQGQPAAVSIDTLVASLASVAGRDPSKDQVSRMVYDAAGRLAYAIDAVGAVMKTEYDGANRVVRQIAYAAPVSILNSIGEVTVAQLASGGLYAVGDTPADDRVSRNFYDDDGRIRGTLDGEGFLVEFEYDGAGRLVTQTRYAAETDIGLRAAGTLDQLRPLADADDIATHYFYDASGRQIGVVDGEGYLTEKIYDIASNLAQVIRYGERVTWGPAATVDSLRTVANGVNHITNYRYDGLGRVVQETNFEGTVSNVRYDAAGHAVRATAAAGTDEERTIQARYDNGGRLKQELSAEGSAAIVGGMDVETAWNLYSTRHEYDAADRRVSTTDAQGNRSLFFYDESGALRFTVLDRGNGTGELMEARYNALGQLTVTVSYMATISTTSLTGGLVDSVVLARAAAAADALHDVVVTKTYKANGLVDTVTLANETATDADDARTSFSYNKFGELTAKSERIDATRTREHSFDYDRRGLQTLIQWDPAGVNQTQTNDYDAFGRLHIATDQYGNTTVTDYDRLGRVLATHDALDNTLSMTYDAFSRVHTSTDALNRVTSYSYDDVNRSATITTPELISITTVHNRHGQTLTVSDSAGLRTGFEYDVNGNAERSYDAMGTLESRLYDRTGRVTDVIDANEVTTHFTYDAANRVLTHTQDYGGLALQTVYEYDGQGRVSRVTEPGGKVTETLYYKDGRTREVILDPSGLNLRTGYTYDLTGNVVTVTEHLGSALPRVTQYKYDDLGRRTEEIEDPTELGGTLNLRTRYRYDRNGNVTRKIDSHENATWYVYDALNRLTHTVDATGGVTQLGYDAQGRIISSRGHVTPLTTAQINTLAALERPTAADVPVQADALDRRSNSFFDRDGRETYTVDGRGVVTQRQYDIRGNVTRLRVISGTQLTGSYADADAVATALGSAANSLAVADRVTWTAYDARNRAELSVSSANALVGSVRRVTYDDVGNVVSTRSYASARALSLPMTIDALRDWATATASGDDQVTLHWFDAVSRERFQIDAEGYLTETRFDDTTRATTSVAYHSRPQNVGAGSPIVDVAAAAIAAGNVNPSRDQITVSWVDVAGRARFALDAEGYLSEVQYNDNTGAAVTTAYAERPLAALTAANTLEQVSGNRVLTPARDRTQIAWVDAAGRRRFTLDGEGYLVETRYNDTNGARSVIVYLRAQTAFSAASTLAAFTAPNAILVDSEDQTSRTEIDGANRIVRAIDADQKTEHFAYNGVGDKVKFTNQNGTSAGDAAYTWDYSYDAAGNLLTETTPNVDVYGVTDNGASLSVGAASNQRLTTRFEYDFLGNVTHRYEAYATGQQRLTRYEYDALGRQVRTYEPGIDVYDVAGDAQIGASGSVPRTELNRTIFNETVYDALGNAFRSRRTTTVDADIAADRGVFKFKTYDRMGRVVLEIDAMNFVTRYEYDAFGNQTRVTRHADDLGARPSVTSTSLRTSDVSVSPLAEDRTIITDYDRRNLAVSVRMPLVGGNVVTALGTASTAVFEAEPTTTSEYNAFGEVVVSKRRIGLAPGVTENTYSYYDRRGNKTAQIDAAKYLTKFEYDQSGNLKRQLEFANKVTGTITTTSYVNPVAAPTTLPVSDEAVANGYDRDTLFSYDRLNRLRWQTEVGIENSSFNGQILDPDNFDDLTTFFGYDALGNRTRITDAGGNTTYMYYDVLGRNVAVAGTRRALGNGTFAAPFTRMLFDAHGNMVQQIQYADPFGEGSATSSYPVSLASDVDDRTTTIQYDAAGHAIRTEDGIGADRYASYDMNGQVAKEWQQVVNPNDPNNGSDDTTQALVTLYHYNARNEVTETVQPISHLAGGSARHTWMAYNAFGEVISKGTAGNGAGPAAQEFFDYDSGGRVWRTNTGDGVTKVYLYDLAGRATVELRAQGIELKSGATTAGAAPIALNSLQDVLNRVASGTSGDRFMRTETVYDEFGNVVEKRLPQYTITDGLQQAGPDVQIGRPPGGSLNIHLFWTGHLSLDTQTRFRYRVHGSSSDWSELNVGSLQDGYLGSSVMHLANEEYDYLITINRVGSSANVAETSGTFHVDRDAAIDYDVDQDDTENVDIGDVQIQTVGPGLAVGSYNGTAGWDGSIGHWRNSNAVNLALPAIGPQQVQITVYYTNAHKNGDPGNATSYTTLFQYTPQSLVELRWSEPPGDRELGGIYPFSISRVVVMGESAPGVYNVLIGDSLPQVPQPYLIWPLPTDAGLVARFRFKPELAPDANYSTWITPDEFGPYYRIDAKTRLTAADNYEYQIEYLRAGEVVARKGGILNSTGATSTREVSGPLGEATFTTLNEQVGAATRNGTVMTWAAPSLAVDAVFEYTPAGGSPIVRAIDKSLVDVWRMDFDFLPSGSTGTYAIRYRIGDRLVAQATGSYNVNTPPSTTTTDTEPAPDTQPAIVANVGTVSGFNGVAGAGAQFQGTAGWNSGIELWVNSNQVGVGWADIGNRPVKVTLTYTKIDRQGNPAGTGSYTTPNAIVAPQTAVINWGEPGTGASTGGIWISGSIAIQVYGADASGNYNVLLRSSSGTGTVGPPSTSWTMPAGTNATAHYYLDGVERTVVVNGTTRTVDLTGVSIGDHAYEIRYIKPGDTQGVVYQTGTVRTNGVSTSIIGTPVNVNRNAQWVEVTGVGSTIRWTHALSNGWPQGVSGTRSVTFRYQDNQGNWQTPTPVTADNEHYSFDFQGMPDGPYPYEIIYRGSGETLPYAIATGRANVDSELHTNAKVVDLGSRLDTTVPQLPITGATILGDQVSWNFGKVYDSTDSVRFIYTVNANTANAFERTVELAGNGPAFSARMSEVPLGDHSVPWRIEYRRAGEDYPYAKTTGTATLHITGTPINPTITEVDEYELPVAGNSPIERPITLPDGFLGWSTPTNSPTDVVRFFYNSTNEVTAVPNGTGWKVDLRNLPEATYTYRIEYRATANGTAYAVVTGTFAVGHPFGEVTGYGRTIDAPHAETVPPPTLTIETVLTPHPPQASWTQITPYAGHVAYIPVVNTAANGGGWMQIGPKSLQHPQGLFALASGYFTSSDKQIIFGSGTSTDSIAFEIAPASNPTSFSPVSIYTITGGRLAVNINALSGAYKFRITYTRPGAPVAYAMFTGDFNATSNSLTFDPAVGAQGPQVAAPTLGQSFDRWGNLLASRDAAGNFTSFRYNQHNQELRRIEASVETLETVPAIAASAVSPEFRNFYDKLGNLIATRDAQGNESRFHYNQVGQLLWQQNADAGRYGNATMQYAYDAYGNVVRSTDQLGFETRTVYDRVGRVTDIVREVDDGVFSDTDTRSVVVNPDFEYYVQRTKYVYDEAGRRVRETNGENESIRYSYDLTGNLLVRRTPLGYAMTYEYDINGRKTAEQDAVFTRSEWTYNYFGQLTDHIGKRSLAGTNAEMYGSGGATDYDYHYNYAGMIDYQSTSAGMLVRYQYDEAGQLATINDATIGRLTNYVYDTAGRHVRERVIIDGLVHQDTRTTYDSHNRISNLNDTDYRVNYSYDRNGNRTLIKATYRDQFGTSINQTLYYTYDEMNRVLVSQGTTFGSGDLMSVVATTAQGIELAYNARGDRESAKTKGDRWEFSGGGYSIAPGIMTSEYYNYDGLGRLVKVEKETELALNNRSDLRIYFYDHADRVIAESDYYLDGSQKKARVTGTTYDDNGQVLRQSTANNGVTESIVTYGNGNLASIIPVGNGVNGWTAGYDAAGNLRGYDVSIRDPGDGHELYVNQYRNYYTLGESYLLNTQTAQPDRTGNGIPLHGTVYRLYNQNEELTEFRDSSSQAQDKWRIFANNQAGQALTTINQDFGHNSIKAAWEYAVSHSAGGGNLKVQHFFFADGNSVGSFGQLSPDGSGAFTANFDVNYTPISASYPSTAPQTLVAVAGDTPRSIAARIYGDGNLWYVIARENLFSSPDEAITEGTVVKLPNEVVSLANSSSVFKPFDASLVLGDTTPTQPMPPPKQGGCGVIGMIIMIVVAVVLSVITAGAAAAALATAWGAVAGTVSIASVAAAAVGGAIGGIVGSIASQAVGIAIGAQEKFSWKAVAQGALSGAVGGALFGVSDVSGAFGSKTFTAFTESLGKAGPYVAGGLQSAASSAITQGLSVAVGLQDKFSWRQVAAAAVGGVAGVAVGNLVGPTLGRTFGEKGGKFATDAVTRVASGIASARVTGGKIDYVNIAADAFGNAIGNATALAVGNWNESRKLRVLNEQLEQALAEAQAIAQKQVATAELDAFELQQTGAAAPATPALPPVVTTELKIERTFKLEIPEGDTLEEIGIQKGFEIVGLSADVNALVNQSGTLMTQLGALLDRGGKIFIDGGQTRADTVEGIVYLNPHVSGRSAADYIEALAHELGHIQFGPARTEFGELTREQYVSTNVNRRLASEGEATLNVLTVREELLAAGQIDISSPGRGNNQKYLQIFQELKTTGNRASAQQKIGEIFRVSEHPNDPTRPPNFQSPDTYGQDLTKSAEENWGRFEKVQIENIANAETAIRKNQANLTKVNKAIDDHKKWLESNIASFDANERARERVAEMEQRSRQTRALIGKQKGQVDKWRKQLGQQ